MFRVPVDKYWRTPCDTFCVDLIYCLMEFNENELLHCWPKKSHSHFLGRNDDRTHALCGPLTQFTQNVNKHPMLYRLQPPKLTLTSLWKGIGFTRTMCLQGTRGGKVRLASNATQQPCRSPSHSRSSQTHRRTSQLDIVIMSWPQILHRSQVELLHRAEAHRQTEEAQHETS